MTDETKPGNVPETPEGAPEEQGGRSGRKRKKMTMKEQIREIMPLVYVLIIGAIGYGIYFAVTYNWASEFELVDQRHNTHTVDFTGEKPVVIAFSDMDSSSELQAWVPRLMMAYGDRIESYRIADFTKLDGQARYFAPGFLARIPVTILIDEDGAVSKQYRYKGGEATLYVISPTGTIKTRVHGELTDAKWEELKTAVDGLLESGS